MNPKSDDLTGRCYCGAAHLTISCQPQTVAVCHCADCRRATGAAVPAFAAFPQGTVALYPPQDEGTEIIPGVRRWFCRDCGSPLAATFDYLPGQVYVPVGVLDQAAELTPEVQCHSVSMLPWITTLHSLPGYDGSARAVLSTKDAPQ